MGEENYIFHWNEWWWGRTVTLVSKGGYASVELQFDNSLPNMAVIKGLMVFTTRQRKGYGTEMLNICHEIARSEHITFLQLSANKEQQWLVDWYERFGFTIIAKDEHEVTMIKQI